jgi:hypothetical protein
MRFAIAHGRPVRVGVEISPTQRLDKGVTVRETSRSIFYFGRYSAVVVE